MSASRTRSETALIRPFANIDPADGPLQEVRLIVGDASHEAGSVVLEPELLRSAKLRLRLPEPMQVKAAVSTTPVPYGDTGLVVIASGKSNRVSRIVVQEYLKPGAWPTELVLTRESADLVFNDRAGFTVTVAVALLHKLTREPLRPYMAGTWLAKREFSVSPEREDTSFSPEELTDEIRVHLQLPENTMRYVHVGEWQEADLMSDQVRVYVDRDVLNLLLASPADASSIQMQIELAVNAMEVVAETICRELSSDGTPPVANAMDGYAAARRFFESLASNLDLSMEDVLQYSTLEPARLRAHLESAFNLRAATTAALKEK